jgi:hypothetical protein
MLPAGAELRCVTPDTTVGRAVRARALPSPCAGYHRRVTRGVSRSLTIVAGYGDKSADLQRLLADCQARLQRELGAAFRPYPLPQIHATLVGLERDPRHPERHRLSGVVGLRASLDVAGFVEHLVARWRPLSIRFGGFEEAERPFTSRGELPFARSFSVQRDKAVLIGWPVERPGRGTWRFPEVLEGIRREARRFGIVHAYHVGSEAMDNDCYLRVGLLDDAGSGTGDPGERMQTRAQRVRKWLSRCKPCIATLTLEDLSLVRYSDDTLPSATSEACALTDTGRLRRWLAAERR